MSLMMQNNEKLKRRLFTKLQALLPGASSGIDQLVNAVVSLNVPVDSPLLSLLQDKCSSHEIHHALIYCRNSMLTVYGQEPGLDKSKLIQQILSHHDRLVMLLLHDVEGLHEHANEVMQARLLHEGHERIVSKASYVWKQENEVQLYNYYKEVPVCVMVKLLHVDEQSLTVRKSREVTQVFAASALGNTALVRLPKNELCMRLTIEEVSEVGIHLRYGGFLSVDKEKRRSIRVQTHKPTVVKIKNAQHQSCEAVMRDFSDSGMGLSFEQETALQPGDAILLSLFINDQPVKGKGVISWAKNTDGKGAVGVGIEYSNQSFRLFSNEVLKRKKAILNELKKQGAPSDLL